MLVDTDKRLLVFIPAYNCEKQISRVIRRVAQCSFIESIERILILDNRSSDNTLATAVAAVKELTAVTRKKFIIGRNVQNVGLGGSHKVALSYAKQDGFSHLVVLHGDDQGDIEDTEEIIKSGDYLRYDACLGARFHEGARLSGYSRVRIFGNRVFNLLYSLCSRSFVSDLGSGLNIFCVDSLDVSVVDGFENDLTFNCFLLLSLKAERKRIVFFPISWREDDQVSNVKLFRQAWRTLLIPVRYFFSGKNALVVKNMPIVRKEFEIIYREAEEEG